MSSKVATAAVSSHRVIGESRPAMLKAHLPKGEKSHFQAEIGACLDFARRMQGWTVDQLAAELGRDSKQVARWMRGEERCQVDVVWSVECLRADFVIALAKLAASCEVTTTISVRRTA